MISKASRFLILMLLPFLVFLLSWSMVFTLKINTLSIQSEDTIPALFLPAAIIKDHTLYLDNYYTMMLDRYPQPDDKDHVKGNTPFYLKKIVSQNGGVHYASAFPIITPLISLPVFAVAFALGTPVTWDTLALLGHISGSSIVSLSGMILYMLLQKQLQLDEKKSLLLTAVYLFGTVNFAMISQAMWQHGTLELFVLLGVYFLLSADNASTKKYLHFLLSGSFFGLAILSRPTAALPMALFGAYFVLYTFLRNRNLMSVVRNIFPFVLGIILNVLFFFWYNNTFYLSIENQGYSDQLFSSWLSPFPQSLLGVWLSPSKGILVYSPVIAFAFVGFFILVKKLRNSRPAETLQQENSTRNLFLLTSVLVFFLHTLVISFWKHWYGGWSFGYRMSSDAIPFMVLAIVPFMRSQAFEKYKKLFYVFFVISVLVELSGMAFFDSVWHAAYDRGFRDTSWLWSLQDSEFAFNFRRVLVKVGLLAKACPKC